MKIGGRITEAVALLLLGAACCVNAGEVLVTCGSVIKLRHDETRFHLHSHVIKWGGGSGQQSVTAHGGEDDQGSMWIVSAFGDSGEGDGGDSWELTCVHKGSENWARDESVRLKHVATNKYLHTTSGSKFTQSNCPNCPIIGQTEVVCTGSASLSSWKADQGIFLGGTS